jgi:hypothetical protein
LDTQPGGPPPQALCTKPGNIRLVLYNTQCGAAKVAKTAAGMAATPRTATLAEDRSVNKPYSSAVLQLQSSQFKLCIAAYLILLIEKPLEITLKPSLKAT